MKRERETEGEGDRDTIYVYTIHIYPEVIALYITVDKLIFKTTYLNKKVPLFAKMSTLSD